VGSDASVGPLRHVSGEQPDRRILVPSLLVCLLAAVLLMARPAAADIKDQGRVGDGIEWSA
jgi:hypothetical protein